MGFIKFFGAASALVSLVSAVPLDLEKRGAAFRLDQTVQKPFILSGPAAMAKTYAKYGKPVPDVIAAAAASNAGTVPANPEEYDSEYLCPVTVGSSTLMLDFDTGSSDLWVFSTELPASEQSGHSVYNPATSGKVDAGETWSISYGDGSSASGNVYFDKVVVGGTTVNSQAVEAAQKISAQFQSDTANDGLLGLAFDSINTASPNQVATFFDNAKPTLAAPVFTANLKKGTAGNYNFGYVDSSEYSGDVTYVPVNTANGFWEFTSNGYAVGSGAFKSSSIDAIADTGTTLLYLPDAIVTAYYSKVSGAVNSPIQGGYIFPCSAALPSITLGIGGYKAVVPGSYVSYAPAGDGECFGGIQSDTGIGFSIFGDIFLKSQFVVFNGASSPELGFAAKPT